MADPVCRHLGTDRWHRGMCDSPGNPAGYCPFGSPTHCGNYDPLPDALESLAGYALVVPPEDDPIRQLGLQPSVVVIRDNKMYFYDQVELDTFIVSVKKASQ